MENESKFEKLKKKFSIANLFYVVLIGLVIITSLVPVIFDPTRIQDKGFQADLILNIALTILTYVVAIMDYSTKARIKEAFVYFVELLKKLDRKITEKALSFIFKFFVGDFNKEKKNEYIANEFEKHLIPKQFQDADINVVKRALEEKLITKEQYDIIVKCKSNKFHVEQYEVNEMRTYKDYRSSSYSVKSNRNSIIIWGIIPKIIYIVVISVLFTSFVRDTVSGENGVDKFDALLKLIIRLFNIVSAIWFGYIQSESLIKDEIRIMEIKIAFMEDFFSRYETGQWKPSIDIEESVADKLKELDLEYRKKNGEIFNELSPGLVSDSDIIEVSEEDYNKIIMKEINEQMDKELVK